MTKKKLVGRLNLRRTGAWFQLCNVEVRRFVIFHHQAFVQSAVVGNGHWIVPNGLLADNDVVLFLTLDQAKRVCVTCLWHLYGDDVFDSIPLILTNAIHSKALLA